MDDLTGDSLVLLPECDTSCVLCYKIWGILGLGDTLKHMVRCLLANDYFDAILDDASLMGCYFIDGMT